MSAQHGRWILRDPLDYVDGVNIYEYVKSNPGRWVDPLGSATTIPCPGYITDDDTYTDFATCDYYTYTGDAHHPYKTNADIKAECCEKLAHDSAETRAALLATGYECDEGYGPPSPSSSGATWCRKYHGVTDVQVLACRVESNVPTKVRGIRGLVTATALVVFEVKIEFFVACDIVEIEQPLPWPK